MLDALYAVRIKTTNLDKLKKFYADKLGLKVQHSCAGCAILTMGGKQYVILQKSKAVKGDLGDTAPVIIGFSTSDVAELHKKLTKQSVKFVAGPKDEDWGATIAAALDPDGNSVVFVQEKAELAKAERCSAEKDTDE